MNENDYNEIYRYLQEEMGEEERASFERRLMENPELNQEAAFNGDLLNSIALYGDTRLTGAIRQAAENARQKGLLITDEHIIQYLNDELPEEQTAIFESRLASDEAFAQEVEFQQNLLASVGLAGDEALKSRIRQTHSQLEKKGFFQSAATSSGKEVAQAEAKQRRLFPLRALAAAATVLLLLALGYFLYPGPDPARQLYAAHYQPDEAALQEQMEQLSLVGMAISGQARRESLKAALQTLEAGDPQAAAQALRQHLGSWPEDESAVYFLGLSLLEAGVFREAAGAFRQLTEKTGATYRAKALWYLGLSCLQLPDEKEEAKEIFTQISADPSSVYQRQAEEILKAME